MSGYSKMEILLKGSFSSNTISNSASVSADLESDDSGDMDEPASFDDAEEEMGITLVSNFRIQFCPELIVILEEMDVRFEYTIDEKIFR
jgi:hypothetical protein